MSNSRRMRRHAQWGLSTCLAALTACSLDRAPVGEQFGVSVAGTNGGGAAANGGGAGNSGLGGNVALAGAGNGAGSGAGNGAGSGAGSGAGNGAGTGGVGVGTLTDAGMGDPKVNCATTTVQDGMCRATTEGVYALKTEVDVWWHDEVNPKETPLVDPGRGKITVQFMAEISSVCDDGSAALTKLRTCGARLPPFFVDAVCKVIHIEFPDAMWDSPKMPTYYTRANTSGFNPGDLLEVAQVTGLLGIELPDIEATWPLARETATFACPSGSGEQCFPDQDGDGNPGVTVHMYPGGTVTDAPYDCGSGADWQKSAAPLSIGNAAFGLAGADTAYIGLRMALGGKGKFGSDCQSGVGPGASSLTIPSRVVQCIIETGKACTASDADFVDGNVPNYHLLQAGEAPPVAPDWEHVRENPTSPFIPKVTLDRSVSLGPRMSMVRLGNVGEPFECAQVRAANFPPFE